VPHTIVPSTRGVALGVPWDIFCDDQGDAFVSDDDAIQLYLLNYPLACCIWEIAPNGTRSLFWYQEGGVDYSGNNIPYPDYPHGMAFQPVPLP
jgi:hypothetical protein